MEYKLGAEVGVFVGVFVGEELGTKKTISLKKINNINNF